MLKRVQAKQKRYYQTSNRRKHTAAKAHKTSRRKDRSA